MIVSHTFRISSRSFLFKSSKCNVCDAKRRTSHLQSNDISQWKTVFEEHARRNNFTSFLDWYGAGSNNLDQHMHKIVRKHFKGSLYGALCSIYPEIEWHPWKFQYQNVPRNFWKEQSNQRKFFDELGKTIGIKTLDDWYDKLSRKLIQDNNGINVFRQYDDSPMAALQAAYPEHNWIPWKFNSVPRGFWNSIHNQRWYFDWLGQQIGIQSMEDWYLKLSKAIIVNHGGAGLLKLYRGSTVTALTTIYAHYQWEAWKFNTVPDATWDSEINVKQFLASLADKLYIQTLDDWYRVDLPLLHHFGAGSLMLKYKGLYNLLKEQYPSHPWDEKRFRSQKKAQKWLALTVKKMFPNEEIVEDYLHPKVMTSSNRPLQLDVFIPSKSLGFEYQGQQHFEDIGFFSPAKIYQQRDEEKRALCGANSIKLIEVPYWWNRTQKSLQELIQLSQ